MMHGAAASRPMAGLRPFIGIRDVVPAATFDTPCERCVFTTTIEAEDAVGALSSSPALSNSACSGSNGEAMRAKSSAGSVSQWLIAVAIDVVCVFCKSSADTERRSVKREWGGLVAKGAAIAGR